MKSIGKTTLVLALILNAASLDDAFAQCSTVYTFTGERSGGNLGHSVSGAGDVNSDGYADIIVGEWGNERAYVYSGLDGTVLLNLTGNGGRFGWHVDGAGDVNNDGYDDVIVGARIEGAHVYSGKDGAILHSFNTGLPSSNYPAHTVSKAGDVNSDGHGDLIVGFYVYANGKTAGRAHVYSGSSGELLFSFTSEYIDHLPGWQVSEAGDVNNDGYDDVIAGFGKTDPGLPDIGLALVYSGQDGGLLYTFSSGIVGDLFGHRVAGVGDIDGDGFDDLAVGANWSNAAGYRSGRAYIYSGQSGALLHVLTGEGARDGFGYVSGGGDVNGDGFSDILVGASGSSASGSGNIAGRAYIYSGATGFLLYTVSGEASGDAFGTDVSIVGDMNNDGFDDLVVGAQYNDAGAANAGRAYVYSCSPPTLSVSLDIKPRSCPNPLNIKTYPGVRGFINDAPTGAVGKLSPTTHDSQLRDVIPAAILGSAELDVADIDVSSLTLAGIAPIRSNVSDVAAPVASKTDDCDCDTLGPDGFDDLTLKFDKASIVEAIGEVGNGDIIALTLAGQLLDGTPIEGVDCVIIRANGPKDGGAGEVKPGEFVLGAAYPNPFNPATKFNLVLPEASEWSVVIYNISGQKVDEYSGFSEAGVVTVVWDAAKYASGVYFYKASAGKFSATRKVTLLK